MVVMNLASKQSALRRELDLMPPCSFPKGHNVICYSHLSQRIRKIGLVNVSNAIQDLMIGDGKREMRSRNDA